MKEGRIVIITGTSGTGKTTTAQIISQKSDLEKSIHLHTDDFYHYLVNSIFARSSRTKSYCY